MAKRQVATVRRGFENTQMAGFVMFSRVDRGGNFATYNEYSNVTRSSDLRLRKYFAAASPKTTFYVDWVRIDLS